MLPYTAYLRVYEPLSAFPEAEGRRWAAYAASADRPRRASALAAEQADAVRRLLALTPAAAPERESADAYVRWADGATYICPWQTRLRCWLALARLRETAPTLLPAAFHSAGTEEAIREFSRSHPPDWPLRVYIQACTWSLPPEWFVPFAPGERWLVLGSGGRGQSGAGGGAGDGCLAEIEPGDVGRATAAATRTLVYATTMANARRRVARALAAVRGAGQAHGDDRGAGAGREPGGHGLRDGWGLAAGRATVDEHGPARMLAGLEQMGRWLDEFDPQALVELDYGGLVHLLSDGALRADQSVAEVGAVVRALGMNEYGLAAAMHRRVTRRWEPLESLRRAS